MSSSDTSRQSLFPSQTSFFEIQWPKKSEKKIIALVGVVGNGKRTITTFALELISLAFVFEAILLVRPIFAVLIARVRTEVTSESSG